MSDQPIPFDVRDPVDDDLAEVARLYAHYVNDSHATFDTVAPTISDWRTILDEQVRDGPHELLVADTEQHGLVGFARTHPFMPRGGYATSAAISVYVAPGAEGQGVGGALYDQLLPRLEAGPFHRVLAGIAKPNRGSERFHERYGFRHVGTFSEVGYKHGRYWDVAWYERSLGG